MNRLTTAAAIALIAMAGCAPTSTPASSPGTTSTTPTQPSTTPDATDAGSATPAAGTSSSTGGDVVASRSTTTAGNTFTLRLRPLQRSGSTVVLSADLVVDKASGDVVASRDLLSDPNDSVSQAKGSMNGIALIDAAGQKLFMPATLDQSSSSAVCSPTFPAAITAGDSITVSCTYAEIPTTITRLDVQAPHFGTITNVPLR